MAISYILVVILFAWMLVGMLPAFYAQYDRKWGRFWFWTALYLANPLFTGWWKP